MQNFPYISRGQKVCQSTHHKDMFIINAKNGSFHTVYTSVEQLLLTHKPDVDQTFKYDDNFHFVRTSSYKSLKPKANNYWQDLAEGKIKVRIRKPRERYDN